MRERPWTTPFRFRTRARVRIASGEAVTRVPRVKLVSRPYCLLLRKGEELCHLRPRLTHVRKVLAEAAVVAPILPAIELALEVVVARRALLVARSLAAMLDHFLHPPLLG